MGLQQFERRLERLVEGAFAKAFRSELQPVEIGRRLTREMDLRRAVSVRGLIAPNAFEIQLAPPDYDRFEGFLETLERELVDSVHEHAQVEQYGFIGPVSVTIDVDDELAVGTFVIISEAVEGEGRPLGWIRTTDGRQIMVTNEPVTIGRLPECGIVLADSNASRHHAELRPDGDAVILMDLGSTNGTRVNGTLVHEHRLRSGDRIAIGTTTLVFEAD